MLVRMGMGAELVLLAIDDRRGAVRNGRRMGLVVAAAELVELALAGHVGLVGAHLTVRKMGGVEEDPELSSALAKLAAQQRPTTVEAWLAARGDLGRVRRCVLELERDGVVRADDSSKQVAGDDAMVVHVEDRDLSRGAVDRFRGVARGDRVSVADEAFAALADAAGLTRVYLGGLSNRRARARISTLTAHRSDPPPEPGRTVLAIVRAALRAMAEAARRDNRGGDGGGSIAIPIDQQFGMQPGIRAAWSNPNIP